MRNFMEHIFENHILIKSIYTTKLLMKANFLLSLHDK